MLMMTTTPDDGRSEFWLNGDNSCAPIGFDDTIDIESLFRILDEPSPLPPPPPPQPQQQLLDDPSQINSLCLSGKDAPYYWSSSDFGNHEGSCSHADASASHAAGTSNLNIVSHGLSSENSAETTEASKKPSCPCPTEVSISEANEASRSGSVNIIDTGIDQLSESVTANGCSVMQPYLSEDVADFSWQQLHNSTDNQFLMPNYVDMLTTWRDGVDDYPPCLNGKSVSTNLVRGTSAAVSEDSTVDFFCQGSDSVESVAVNSCSSGNTSPCKAQSLNWTLFENKKHSHEKYEINSEPFLINSAKHFAATSVDHCGGSSVGFDAGRSALEFECNGQMTPPHTEEFLLCRPPPESSFGNLLHYDDSIFMKEGSNHARTELTSARFGPSGVQPEVFLGQRNCSYNRGNDDDDITEISSIEYVSQCARASPSLAHQKPLTYQPKPTPPLRTVGISGTRLKHDERLIYQAALQDLSQPKSEASPPEGVLAVPLLRHQRIALSWMAQKETASWRCSGGILADDQGLGKTISTIALILKERRPSVKTISDMETSQLETLDLEEDDGNSTKPDVLMKDGDKAVTNQTTSHVAKGRPAAGTLVVCPTSVLRQWAEELHNKVTSKADLSVLVYHGSNRTKDPCELAKYDVVITTYAIVSMEVPKQSLIEKDEKRMLQLDDVPPFTSSKKRKHHPNLDKRFSKKGSNDARLDFMSCPLAKVGWFRVVLDEAQSIKNYRTRVAQACWGLRAKRRWCLSGTPIQNAVDDLYSYFRFLRYDPYATYKSFCSMVKVPISRNPSNGYKKLQAVLKTIMLRRTKGTLLDGQPIISLPPKSVNLKKVEFSDEERDFYMKLEADSLAKFQAYAASGTVEQNYVNILLMLLRLRQACDHPLLAGGYDSSSVLQSSLYMAKKLPQKQQSYLLNCLEASLAICRICSDPPEDAVVSICGHVFCNQCISEHLTGDDNQCPVLNCKVQLNVSSVFSGATLKHCLNDQLSQTKCSDGTEVMGTCLGGRLFESSKIKAALGVLQSLNKPQDCMLDNGLVDSKDSNTCSSMAPNKVPGSLQLNKCPEDSVPVVRDKAIVFSQWTKMLDLLESGLKGSSIKYRRLDGTMPVVARDKAVRDFNTIPEITVMIMSLKAASLGLNMVAACHVILLDLWWNPTTEDQAIDRAHRIGQTRPVTVLRLTVKDTVEDRILALQQKKREMVASAFGEEDEMGSRQTRLTVDDLKYLFMGRSPGIFQGTDNHTFPPI